MNYNQFQICKKCKYLGKIESPKHPTIFYTCSCPRTSYDGSFQRFIANFHKDKLKLRLYENFYPPFACPFTLEYELLKDECK